MAKKKKNRKKSSNPEAATPKAQRLKDVVPNKGPQEVVWLDIEDVINPPKTIQARQATSFNESAIEALKKLIARDGQLQNIVVRPSLDKKGKYEILSGNRRVRAMRDLGLKQVLAQIRTDVETDQKALAIVMAENNENGRTNLTPIEQAHVFQRLVESFGKKDRDATKKVAKICQTSMQNVRNTLRLLEESQPILILLESGRLSKEAAIQLGKVVDPDIHDRVVKVVKEQEGDITGADIQRYARDFAIEAKTEGKSVTSKKGRRGSDPSSVRTWRPYKEISAQRDEFLWNYANAKGDVEDPDFSEIHGNESAVLQFGGSLAALLWVSGQIDAIDCESSDFEEAYKIELDRVKADRGVTPEDAEGSSDDEEPSEDEGSKPKKGKKKRRKDRELQEA